MTHSGRKLMSIFLALYALPSATGCFGKLKVNKPADALADDSASDSNSDSKKKFSHYRIPISITPSGTTLNNFQIAVTIDTASLISASKMDSSCLNIRFEDSDASTYLDHYYESGCNTAQTLFWVKVPFISSSESKTIYLNYGPISKTVTSSLQNTFPNRYVAVSGSSTLGGANTYDWFEIPVGSTVSTTAGVAFSVNARRIKIAGTLDGTAKGFAGQATTLKTAGTGPGAGQTNGNNGGGAGYGGAGGCAPASGASSCGAAGGAANGTQNGTDISMGSGGASGESVPANRGGNGGGSISISGNMINISGIVSANGENGIASATSSFGGGGASGGGILIQGTNLTLSGTLSSNGGKAGNQYGASGGGGRIKIFYAANLVDTSTKTVAGGGNLAGFDNLALRRQPEGVGAAGTTYSGLASNSEPTVTIKAEESVNK